MRNSSRFPLAAAFVLSSLLAGDAVLPPSHSCSEIEHFLMTAHPGTLRPVSAGVTGTRRMTLDDGNLQHDAHLQTVDERKTSFQGENGTSELNFRDSYKYNIAAYELAKLLGLNMVPPYVERRIGGLTGSLSWWVDNAMMELDRTRKKISIPDTESWNQQMFAVHVFHELVYDTDANKTNILITRDWQLWIIDLTRAFRLNEKLREPQNLVRCDRRLLARLRQLDRKTLTETLGRWLTSSEIHALDARRARIVDIFEERIRTLGESAVLYDLARTDQPCGAGL